MALITSDFDASNGRNHRPSRGWLWLWLVLISTTCPPPERPNTARPAGMLLCSCRGLHDLGLRLVLRHPRWPPQGRGPHSGNPDQRDGRHPPGKERMSIAHFGRMQLLQLILFYLPVFDGRHGHRLRPHVQGEPCQGGAGWRAGREMGATWFKKQLQDADDDGTLRPVRRQPVQAHRHRWAKRRRKGCMAVGT